MLFFLTLLYVIWRVIYQKQSKISLILKVSVKRNISNLVNSLMLFYINGLKIILKKIKLFKLIKIILNNRLKKTNFRVTVKLINFFKAVNKSKILPACVT